jgi:Holliday junction DNA helicase RuvA
LKDKVGVAAAWEAASAGHAPGPEARAANDAVLALIALGYKQVDAAKAVRAAALEHKGAGTEELVRLALKSLV